eukprot:4278515-Lingulodinium_polyedra.AAC.1
MGDSVTINAPQNGVLETDKTDDRIRALIIISQDRLACVTLNAMTQPSTIHRIIVFALNMPGD